MQNTIVVTIPFNTEVLKNRGATNGVTNGVITNELNLSYEEKRVLEVISINPKLSAKKLSNILNIPFRSVQRYISTLREKGYIKHIGANKNGYWEVINKE